MPRSETRNQKTHPPTLYNPAFEHDGCGTGFVADIEGRASHRVVHLAVEALVRLTHRGAVSADATSGDGAGVTIQVPRALLAEDAARLGLPESDLDRLAVAMVFLPVDEQHRAYARELLEKAAARTGLDVLGWRPVPIDPSTLGGLAKDTLPGIEQLLIARPGGMGAVDYERALYLARRRAEAGYREHDVDAYIVSMSSRTVVYKGLMVAPQLEAFFSDLADERTVSSVALFHQRFATNTLPNWKLAQPFRMIGHNGEINTLLGNRNWMSAREPELTSAVWGDELPELIPVIWPIGSDSASLDEAFELLVQSGRDLLQAMRMLVPEAWENDPDMDPELRAFYEYHACLMEPWDGPAAIAFTDGIVAAAAMDRNGLRPARYKVTRDGLVVMASEVGLLDIDLADVVESGRVGPGEMIAVDTAERRFLKNDEIKERLASARPYAQWVEGNLSHLEPVRAADQEAVPQLAGTDLSAAQVLHGYTREEIKQVITPMAAEGKEPTGSMGDDTPLSALTDNQRLLYTYFRQRFAQVTNPAIDSIRERIVMSLDTSLGKRHSILEERPEAARLLHLRTPLLSDEAFVALRRSGGGHFSFTTLQAVFAAEGGPDAMLRALDDLCRQATAAVDEGHSVITISDRVAGAHEAPIPMLLAVSTVHHHLIRTGRRQRTSLVAEAGDARDVHHFAALIGFGASAVNPYVVLATVRELASAGELGDDVDAEKAVRTFLKASEAGLLKIMSKMGIAAVASYHGAQIFEALGLSDEVIDHCFPGTTSRIGGIGLAEIAQDVLERHQRAYANADLEAGGWYKYRRGSEYHANEPAVWRALHEVVEGGGREAYDKYLDLVYNRPPTALRDLLVYESDREPIPVGDVEPVENILQRFQTGAMSLGALSRETHEDIARAMNKIGGRANTGEGGEDPRRYSFDGDLRDANSAIKQVASGRFGVTPAYLAGAQELEIKIAQGSKPGEGGQLPGHKVSAYIAGLRHVLPGTPLISPPPHHDIYSIEDIAQLIYDLKMANPGARVCVKLVASEGVGTIAAGVAKAYADSIQISGSDGGTGASPLSSVKYAGDPWELGLAETQQTLVLNGLRGRVKVITDGGMHAGRDIVTAALLGADRFGFGTAALIALGCKMARQCHLNTCPVGIATQAEELRQKYFGTPEMLITFLTHVAEEVREILASLGYASLDEVIGRADLLRQSAATSDRWRSIDLSKVITPVPGQPLHCVQERNDRPGSSLDDAIIEELGNALEDGTAFSGSYRIQNTDRTVGGRISVRIARTHGDQGIEPGTIDLRFAGSAGQSFGAWLVGGVRLTLVGEANDYVAKGMHGGEIVIRPPENAGFAAAEGTLAGNTCLYGATGGSLYLSGRAGERFAVRNSGAVAVVEGVGDHGCEYMTEGVVVVLGRAGRNFGAGMSGGLAFVLDQDGSFPNRLNRELVRSDPVSDPDEIEALRSMIERHAELTGSARAREILADWPRQLESFWRVAPKLTPSRAGASASDAVAPEERDAEVSESVRARAMASRDAGPEGRLEAPPL